VSLILKPSHGLMVDRESSSSMDSELMNPSRSCSSVMRTISFSVDFLLYVHKLQPCDVAVFGPLKTAYRERVEELYHGGVSTVGKQHFTLLYSQARCMAFTPQNIESAWAKAGLSPFNPERVLQSIQKPPEPELKRDHLIDVAQHDEPLQTPVTSEDLASLRRKLEQNIDALDNDGRLVSVN
jgi:hypothetical protein